jgi:hypothetical protein
MDAAQAWGYAMCVTQRVCDIGGDLNAALLSETRARKALLDTIRRSA